MASVVVVWNRCGAVLRFRSLSLPGFFLRERLSEVQDAGAFLVAAIHRGTELCRPELVLATLKREPFTALLLLGDMVDDPSFNRVPRRRWDLLAFTARRRQADVKLLEERYAIARVSWHRPRPAGTTRKERLLRCGVTAHRVWVRLCKHLFFTFRTEADDACA